MTETGLSDYDKPISSFTKDCIFVRPKIKHYRDYKIYNKENVLWDFKMKDFSFSEVVPNQNYDINIPGEQLTDGKGVDSPALFWKSIKNALIFGGNALIVSICGLNFSSKFLIKEKIHHIFSLRGIFFVWFRWNVCQSAVIPRNLPYPVKILVWSLKLSHKSKQIYTSKRETSLEKWSFPLTISSVSVTKPDQPKLHFCAWIHQR